MKSLTFYLIAISSFCTLHTAAPVTHIVLALSVLHLLPPTIDKQAFIVGTSFPDIRYLAKLDRKLTHIEPVTWNDIIKEKSSFRAGMLFHNLVDNIRMQHFEPCFYQRKTSHSEIYKIFFPLVMKTAEDNALYQKIDSWKEISSYFNTVYQEEKDFGIDKQIIKEWHTILQNYLKEKPNVNSINLFLSNEGQKKLRTNIQQFNIKKEFENLIFDEQFKNKLNIFYGNFEKYVHIK
ncbi:MAG: hypothetical protein WD055_03790 [Candidatus Dependentiae bacterium]